MTLPVEIQARMGELRAEIEGAGAELIDVLYHRYNQRSILTFLVDRAGGITLEDCARLNQKLGAFFDRVADTGQGEGAFFQGRYLLEVSSPGLDRPLRTPKDFARVLDQTLRVHHPNGAVIGKLKAVTESGIELEGTGGARHEIPFGDIAKATREIGWKR